MKHCVLSLIIVLLTSLPVHAETALIWRTQPGASVIQPNSQYAFSIQTVVVSMFRQIRVVGGLRNGGEIPVTVAFGFVEGNELILALDVVTLTAQSPVINKVYDVPGTQLMISVRGGSGTGTSALDMLIYGAK
jgi:hypothetical protein